MILYQYYATMMEPSERHIDTCIPDGDVMGAVFSTTTFSTYSYYITNDGFLILSSGAVL